MLVVEYFFRINFFGTGRSCDITFALLPMTGVLLLLAINWKGRLEPQSYELMRSYSMLAFLLQRIPLTLFRWIDSFTERFFGVYYITKNPVFYFFSILVTTVILSVLVMRLMRRHPWIKRYVL